MKGISFSNTTLKYVRDEGLKGLADSYGPNAIIPTIDIKIEIEIPNMKAKTILFEIFF